jgi:hypothetical protein
MPLARVLAGKWEVTVMDEDIRVVLLRDIRREMTDQRTLLLALVDQGQRLERRISETKDDIELMLKAELMGRMGNFETRFTAE